LPLVPTEKDIIEKLETPEFKELFRKAVSSRTVKLCTNCPDLKRFVAEVLGYDEKIVEQYWQNVIYPKLREIYNRRSADELRPEKSALFALPTVTLANVLYFLLYEQTDDAPKIMYELLEPYMVRCLNSTKSADCDPVKYFFMPVDSENIDYVLKLLSEVLSRYPQLKTPKLEMICAVSASMPKVLTLNRKKIKDANYCIKELKKVLGGADGK